MRLRVAALASGFIRTGIWLVSWVYIQSTRKNTREAHHEQLPKDMAGKDLIFQFGCEYATDNSGNKMELNSANKKPGNGNKNRIRW